MLNPSTPFPGLRPAHLLAVAGASCLLIYGWLAWLSRQDQPVDLSLFLLAALICAGLGLIVVWGYSKQQLQIPFFWILISAILFRAAGVFGEPLFEDDFYRYLWDGYRTALSGDPYSFPPSHYFASENVPIIFEPILSKINYPDVATVYGPVCQWIFAAAYTIAPGQIWPLQLFAAMADIGILLLLRFLTQHNALLLYAWSPLLIKEFAFTAHPDVLAVFMVMVAIWLRCFERAWLVGVFLGLAIGIKVFAIVLVPFLLLFRGDFKRSAAAATALLFTLLLITLWFGTFVIWVPEGLRVMAESWLFNAPVYILLTTFLPFNMVKTILLVLFFGFAARLLYQQYQAPGFEAKNPAAFVPSMMRADLLFGAFLLCTPVLNPWYLIWILPFAVLHPSRWAWTASVAVLLSYVTALSGGDPSTEIYRLPNAILILEFGLIAAAMLMDWKRPLNPTGSDKGVSAVRIQG
ncbi:MAG: hypothetical protein ACR2QW_19885 [bacterium]